MRGRAGAGVNTEAEAAMESSILDGVFKGHTWSSPGGRGHLASQMRLMFPKPPCGYWMWSPGLLAFSMGGVSAGKCVCKCTVEQCSGALNGWADPSLKV